MNIHNKIEQWLRLRTRLVPLVVERHVAQFGKTITYKFYRQNKYAGRFITENVCAQPGVTLFFCNCNIMQGGGGGAGGIIWTCNAGYLCITHQKLNAVLFTIKDMQFKHSILEIF